MGQYVVTLLASVFFLSLVSIFGRLLFQVNGYISTFAAYAIVVLLTVLFIAARGNFNEIRLRNRKGELLFLALAQLGSAAFYLIAVQTTELAVAGLLLYSAPVWIALIYLTTKEEGVSQKIILPLALGIVGLVLVLGPEKIMNANLETGLFFGLLAGISYAFSFIFARKVKDVYNATAVVFWNHFIGFLVLLPLAFIIPFAIDTPTLIWWTGTGLSWFLGYLLLYYSLRYVKAQHASLIALAEPVFIAFWGFLLFQEAISLTTFAGGILLLANIYLISKQIQSK